MEHDSVTQPLLSNRNQDKIASSKESIATVNTGNDVSNAKYEQLDCSVSSGRHEIHHETYVAYNTRWYILAIFSLLFTFQAIAWNAWGPIADTVRVVLQWSQAEIDLCINWGPITFVVTAFFFSYILNTKGFRFALLASALFFLSGVAVRCIPVGIENVKWTANIGQVLIGVSAPILQAAPTHLSATWFPPHQRTTSTAIAGAAGCLGMAFSFLIGPNIVPAVPKYIT